jgi:lytic murein transglycosylase
MLRVKFRSIALAALAVAAMAAPATAAPCRNNTGSFERWLDGFKQEAASQGISRATISAALDGMSFDQAIINRDHGQGVFQQSFLQFSDRMVSRDRLTTGPRLMQKHAALFARIEQQYGVPAPVLVAFWGLESDFGSNNGRYPILRAVATLAYDCRRPEFFRTQLLDALRIVDRGDLTPSEMIGDWAGELGAMQFTPSDYYKYAVDFDGDGRRDLVHSVPDTLASAANFLVGLGWRRGEPWLQEVRVPAELPWANFQAFLGWNQAFVYATTAAYLATRLAGAPPIHRGSGTVVPLSAQQVLELQQLLARRGYMSGQLDGKLGLTTRAAVRQAQLKLGMPADSYPTVELINRLRGL